MQDQNPSEFRHVDLLLSTSCLVPLASRMERLATAAYSPALELFLYGDETPPDEVARLAEIAIGLQRQNEHQVVFDAAKDQSDGFEAHDSLLEVSGAQGIRGFRHIANDPTELDPGVRDVAAKRIGSFDYSGSPYLFDRNSIEAHQGS
jgi:hypothetical protein